VCIINVILLHQVKRFTTTKTKRQMKPIITEYRGHFFQTVKKSDSYVTYSFSDKNLTNSVKAMTASGLHEGAEKSIEKSKAKLDSLLK